MQLHIRRGGDNVPRHLHECKGGGEDGASAVQPSRRDGADHGAAVEGAAGQHEAVTVHGDRVAGEGRQG